MVIHIKVGTNISALFNRAASGENDIPCIINYVAGNSICTMLPLTSIIDTYMGRNYQEISELTNVQYSLGLSQFGSMFNHSHKGLTTDSFSKNNKYNTEYIRYIQTDSKNTCIGMMNLQYAGNYFECNNNTKSIGYAYTGGNDQNILPFGQYMQTSGINGTNYDGSNQLSNNIINITGDYISKFTSPITGISYYAKTVCSKKLDTYNNGNFWKTNLVGKSLTNAIKTENTGISGFIDNLVSFSTEDLYLVSKLSYYFCTSGITNRPAPIGLWEHNRDYITSGTFTEQAVQGTFLISDRFNMALRNEYCLSRICSRFSKIYRVFFNK